MSDEADELFAERLKAKFGTAKPKANQKKPAADPSPVDDDVDRIFAERLMAQGDRKLQRSDRKEDQ